MEGIRVADEGRRTINILDRHWKPQKMTHRVVEKMRHPLVSAGETVDAQNLVFMSRDTSFIVPESSDYGWALNQAVWELGASTVQNNVWRCTATNPTSSFLTLG